MTTDTHFYDYDGKVYFTTVLRPTSGTVTDKVDALASQQHKKDYASEYNEYLEFRKKHPPAVRTETDNVKDPYKGVPLEQRPNQELVEDVDIKKKLLERQQLDERTKQPQQQLDERRSDWSSRSQPQTPSHPDAKPQSSFKSESKSESKLDSKPAFSTHKT